MEQYSSNSNAAVEAIIKAHPTLIGQYRAAWMHITDREDSLVEQRIGEALTYNKIAQLELTKEQLMQKLSQLEEGGFEYRRVTLQVQGLTLRIEKAGVDLGRAQRLVSDAIRERDIAKQQLQRIIQDAGVEIGELTSDQFQLLMTEEYNRKLDRWLVAHTTAPQLGIAPEAIEHLLELSPERLQEVILSHQTLLMAMGNGFAIARTGYDDHQRLLGSQAEDH